MCTLMPVGDRFKKYHDDNAKSIMQSSLVRWIGMLKLEERQLAPVLLEKFMVGVPEY